MIAAGLRSPSNHTGNRSSSPRHTKPTKIARGGEGIASNLCGLTLIAWDKPYAAMLAEDVGEPARRHRGPSRCSRMWQSSFAG